MTGRRLAHYEIVEKIGQGGMGEVWRARDTRLERDVALKFLPPEFAADPERLARFRNEAKLLAALGHANIAAIHGLEDVDGEIFLAMEYVPGEDLAQRLRRGALPQDEVLDLARQLTEGLESAHERGIVHRDLKPANLKVTPEGRLKILDFGLARAFVEDAGEPGSLLDSPTLTAALTRQGVILGTAAYMSPEQAHGRTVDERTDIWSFGVVLWEMLTAERLFTGETASDTMAAVLRADLDFTALPAETPEGVRRLLRRCLERDARRRLRDIGEARVRLERWRDDPDSIHESGGLSGTFEQPAAGRRAWLPWAVACLAACAAGFLGWRLAERTAAPAPVVEWAVEAPGEDLIDRNGRNNVLVSPDGQWFGWITAEGIRVRRADEPRARLLPGTDSSSSACFSPDGRWIAFAGRGGLQRISVDGGAPFNVAPAPLSRGVAWVDERTIVYCDGIVTGLKSVDVATGAISALTAPDAGRNERSHRWPSVVPGRRAVLFECQFLGRDYDASEIRCLDLDDGTVTTVHAGGAMPLARAAGHLLFVRGTTLYAVGLDLGSMITRGLPVPVREGLVANVGNQEDDDGSANLALDARGNLFCFAAPGHGPVLSRLCWFSFADGSVTPITGAAEYAGDLRIAPDGRRVAVRITRAGEMNVYVLDLDSGNELLLTNRPSVEYLGAWSPGSDRLYWSQASDDGGSFEIWTRPVDGSRPPAYVTTPEAESGCWVYSVSGDGRWLGGEVYAGGDQRDLFVVDLEASEPRSTLALGGPANHIGLDFIGDGTHYLYAETTGGARGLSVFVRRHPDDGAVWSLPGPPQGWWDFIWVPAAGGVVTVDERGVFVVPLEIAGGQVSIGSPRLLATQFREATERRILGWDIHPDGLRALLVLAEEDGGGAAQPTLTVVLNWERTVTERLRAAAR